MLDFIVFILSTLLIGYLAYMSVQLGIDLSNATEFILR